jgi:hypothetical protein
VLNGRAPFDGVPPAVAALLCLTLLLSACDSPNTDKEPASPAPSPTESNARVANRWEPVAEFDGDGDDRTGEFEISADALQWRVNAVCTGPRMEVRLTGNPQALAAPECPGSTFGFSIQTGRNSLEITAAGPWEITVEQQLNTPIAEAALDGMARETLIATGSFYDIDQSGSGEVKLYELSGGRRVLRLDPFRVTNNSDLLVWVSRTEEPKTSEEAFVSDHVEIARLKSTEGPQNYLLPADLPLDAVRSVIIWCEPIRVAYAAARLER